MIDAEKLLGKILSGAVQSGGTKKKNRKNSDDFLGSLVGGLTSGKGLITAIGLGVGAFEILKQQSNSSAPPSTGANSLRSTPPAVPPPMPSATVPPPVPGSSVGPSQPPAIASTEEDRTSDEQDLATKLIQTMVAAAHADGELDQEEEGHILEKLQEQGLNQEEKQYILSQLHAPKAIDELASGISDPVIAQTMYSLAASTIVVDTEQERQWLDELASTLSISSAMQQFIEEDF